MEGSGYFRGGTEILDMDGVGKGTAMGVWIVTARFVLTCLLEGEGDC